MNIDSNYILLGSAAYYYCQGIFNSVYNYIKSLFLVTVCLKHVNFDKWISTNIKEYEIADLYYDANTRVLKPYTFQKYIIYHHVPLYIMYKKETKMMTITTLNIPNVHKILTKFIQTIDIVEKIDHKCISFYNHDEYLNWKATSLLQFRDVHYIQSSKTSYLDKICQDYNKFKSRKAWYKSKNIVFKRGYLLYGPPGTGKTSLIKNFAFINEMNIYNIKLTKNTTSNDLESLINYVDDDNGIIIFEDIDSLFPKENDIPLSDLLNMFDGLASSERIIFMTTNHPDKLEPSFLRPGRVDYKLKIDYADEEMLYNMISEYRIDLSTKEKNQLLVRVLSNSKQTTLAELQSFLIFHLDHDFNTMINSWDDFYKLEKEFALEFR